jgi:hypothetical protein
MVDSWVYLTKRFGRSRDMGYLWICGIDVLDGTKIQNKGWHQRTIQISELAMA